MMLVTVLTLAFLAASVESRSMKAEMAMRNLRELFHLGSQVEQEPPTPPPHLDDIFAEKEAQMPPHLEDIFGDDEDAIAEQGKAVVERFISSHRSELGSAFERVQKAIHRTKQERSLGELNVCFWCDKGCQNQISGSGYSHKIYFDLVMAHLNKMVQNLDPDIVLALKYILFPVLGEDNLYHMTWSAAPEFTELESYTPANWILSWFVNANIHDDVQQLTYLNNLSWGKYGFWKKGVDKGCDVDFLLVKQSDPVWRNHITNVVGVAGQGSLCLSSYGTVKEFTNPFKTAQIVAHEFGHMVGLRHDDIGVHHSLTTYQAWFEPGQVAHECAYAYEDVKLKCHNIWDCGCNDPYYTMPLGNELHQCIMSPIVEGTSSTYSECSHAYYELYICFTGIWPGSFSTVCANH